MSDLAVEITGFVEGDDLEIRRTITELPAAIAVAWLTVKRHHNQPDEEAKLQKRITSLDVAGTGQIVEPGTKRHVHDIQIKLVTGKVYTIEKGTIQLTVDVTETTA